MRTLFLIITLLLLSSCNSNKESIEEVSDIRTIITLTEVDNDSLCTSEIATYDHLLTDVQHIKNYLKNKAIVTIIYVHANREMSPWQCLQIGLGKVFILLLVGGMVYAIFKLKNKFL